MKFIKLIAAIVLLADANLVAAGCLPSGLSFCVNPCQIPAAGNTPIVAATQQPGCKPRFL